MEKQPKYDNMYYFPIEDWKFYVLLTFLTYILLCFKSRALLLSVLVLWLVAGSSILVGLVVFANYWSCDPLTSLQTNSNNNQASRISREDELVTLFVLDHLVDFLGIPGIFIASLLCGALRYKSNQLVLLLSTYSRYTFRWNLKILSLWVYLKQSLYVCYLIKTFW